MQLDPRFLALIAAAMFGVNPIVVSIGVARSTPNVAVLTTYLVGIPLMILVAPLLGGLHLSVIPFSSILLFAIAGLLGPMLGRTLLYHAIDRLGSSRAFTIKNAAPFVTAVVAVFVLAEPVTWNRWLAIVVIVVGLTIIGRRSSDSPKALKMSGLVLAIFSALAFGVRPVVFKVGLNEDPDPLAASLIATTAAFIGFSIFLLISGRIRTLKVERRSLIFFILVGITHNIGFLIINYAFNAADVSLVFPISTVAPLITFVLSYFILKNIERLKLGDFVGTLAVVAGVIAMFY